MKLSQLVEYEEEQEYALYFDETGSGGGPEVVEGPFPSREAAEKYAEENDYVDSKFYFVEEYPLPDM